jgi:poly(A) polymerase
MMAAMLDPEAQRCFAIEVVQRLRHAGFESYLAGGCVRDQVMGKVPKDYDVATAATPPQIRKLFGQRRTLAIGAAFGVITVLGPKPAGMVEVATFRRDAESSDGRHPDHVDFSSPQEDAARRDFTINGLFYDPLDERVIDFVGGQADLDARLIRAIGAPRDRLGEDKLRMLRAVRFAATMDFALEADTRAALDEMAAQIVVVSPERIAMEMRRMLVEPRREVAVRLLVETGLAAAILPEIVPHDEAMRQQLQAALDVLRRLRAPGFPLALAALLDRLVEPAAAAEIGRRWRLANKEIERVAWLLEQRDALIGAGGMAWSRLQPLVIADGIDDLLALHEIVAVDGPAEAAHVRALLSQPREVLDPPPLLTGDDLLAQGMPAGPRFKDLLQRLRAAQLDGAIHSRGQALELARQWWSEAGTN